jgi:cold shock CspA family protein
MDTFFWEPRRHGPLPLFEGAKVTFDIFPHKGKESAENLKVT